MNRKTVGVLLSGLLFGCVQAAPPAATTAPSPPPAPAVAAAPPVAAEPPPSERIVVIRAASCQRLIELSDEDRAAAVMFYIGYQASRARAQIINVNGIPSITSLALNYCLAHPNRTVAQAFAAAYASYLQSRRG